MNALFSVMGVLLAFVLVFLWLMFSNRCKCVSGPPQRIKTGDWYYHEYTMPHEALRGKVFRVYRRDITFAHTCRKCGVTKHSIGYDQKPHESDTDIVPFPPEGWTPEKTPEPLTFEQLKKLER